MADTKQRNVRVDDEMWDAVLAKAERVDTDASKIARRGYAQFLAMTDERARAWLAYETSVDAAS